MSSTPTPPTPRERELMREIEALKGQLDSMHVAYERAMVGWSEATGSRFSVPKILTDLGRGPAEA